MTPLEQRRAALFAFGSVMAAAAFAASVSTHVDVALRAVCAVAVAAVAAGVVLRRRSRHVTSRSDLARAAAGLGGVVVGAALTDVALAHLVGAWGDVAAAPSAAGVFGIGFASWVRSWVRPPLASLPAPQVGEIWWALVPFEDTTETKDRPMLVTGVRGHAVTGLMFTSQDKKDQVGYLCVPGQVWRQPRRSYLRTDRTIRVRRQDLRRLEGVVDAATASHVGIA